MIKKNNVKNEAYLIIETTKGNLEIPFKKISKIDEFTVRYSGVDKLVSDLSNLLEIRIDVDEVTDAFIYYKYSTLTNNYQNDGIGSFQLPIKYMNDNFDVDSVKYYYAKYLKDDRKRINYSKVRFMNYGPIIDYLNGNGSLSNEQIDILVQLYLTNYKKIRDSYFILKYAGYKVKINYKNKKNKNVSNQSLKIHSTNEYFAHLINQLLKDESRYDEIMDEISSYDIDIIDREIQSSRYGIVDGVSKLDSQTDIDLYELTSLCGITLEDLRIIGNNFRNKVKSRQK